VFGTQDGSVMVFNNASFIKDPAQNLQVRILHEVHSGGCTKMRISAEGRFVFSAGADGALFVFSVKDALSEKYID